MPVQGAASTARASIIICSRNAERLTKCLKALRPTLDARDSRHEIVIVAHAVDLEPVARQYGARLTSYQGSFHFGVMNAQGVQESTGEVLCFLNDDVFPSSPDWLEIMLAQATRPEVGVVGALLLYPDGTIQHAGVVVDRWHPAHVGRFQKDSTYWPWLRMTREVSAVTGACMAMRRSVWDELGGFDPQFPVNYNDIDLCLRASARGYSILIETRAVLIHEEGRTRVAVVRPEEAERFQERWAQVTDGPDPYFNPQFSSEGEAIALPASWTSIR
jgi:glycosyltransferase involved in cell wall biosynthesis